ncbi:hypothetical protein U2A4042370158 [Corynebacterium striatum]|nr:hypothetical protein U2A4042370158 [Corynebacterium striatum]
MLGVDLIRSSRHGAFLSSFAGANQTGSNGLGAVSAPISAHFFMGTRGVLALHTISPVMRVCLGIARICCSRGGYGRILLFYVTGTNRSASPRLKERQGPLS